ncbi:MAG: E3 binding domain-containing protein [Planctomycetota bacterium]|nr:E3 binding domain-containing protein [Planctomycetota bacterium]
MTPVEMPKANENLTEATLEQWLVRVGDAVQAEQALCTIITDKATFEMPSPAAGTVRKLYGEERSLLPVGYILCAIGAPDEAPPEEYESRNRHLLETHRGAMTATAASLGGVAPAAAPAAVRATPVARRLAKELGVDLAEVARVLGLQGPVNEKDVKAYSERKAGG